METLQDVLQLAVSPGGVLVSKGEDVGAPLRHAALHIRNNKVEPPFGLVQGELDVNLQHLQIWTQAGTTSDSPQSRSGAASLTCCRSC